MQNGLENMRMISLDGALVASAFDQLIIWWENTQIWKTFCTKLDDFARLLRILRNYGKRVVLDQLFSSLCRNRTINSKNVLKLLLQMVTNWTENGSRGSWMRNFHRIIEPYNSNYAHFSSCLNQKARLQPGGPVMIVQIKRKSQLNSKIAFA